MTKPKFTEGKWTGPFVLPDIRELVGLDSDEKVLLYDLASHANFTENGTIQRLLRRTGLGPYVFKRVRQSLSELGLIEIIERAGKTWEYKLNINALQAFPKAYIESELSDAARRDLVADQVSMRRSGAPNSSNVKRTRPVRQTPSGRRSGKKNTADKYARKWKRLAKPVDRVDANPQPPEQAQDDHADDGWYVPEPLEADRRDQFPTDPSPQGPQ